MVQIAGCAERWDRVGLVEQESWRQAVDATGVATRTIAPAREPLRWSDEACALASDSGVGVGRLGIRIRAYTLVLLDSDEQLVKTLPLSGLSAAEASAWLHGQGHDLTPPGDFPNPPDAEALVNLDRVVSNMHEAIGHVAHVTHGSTSVSTDPQTLVTTATIELASREGEPPRLIVVGFTPNGGQGELFVRASPGDVAHATLGLHEIARISDVDAQAGAVELFLQESMEEAYAAHSREWRSRRPISH